MKVIEVKRSHADHAIVSLFWTIGIVIFIAALCSGPIGCMGRVYLGIERHDTVSNTQTATDKPLACLFTDCKGGK